MKKNEAKAAVSQDDIASVVSKLEEWKKKLGTDERAVVDLIVERSLDIDPDLVESMMFRNALAEALPPVLEKIIKGIGPIAKPDSWMKVGPIWVKAAASGYEVAPRVFIERVR